MIMFLVTLRLLITLYYLQVAFHFPEWMEEHGSLNLFSAQGMEHSNTETKQGFRKATNRQRQRVTQKGNVTLSRVGQNMNRSLQLARHRAAHGPTSGSGSKSAMRSLPHRPSEKSAAIKRRQAIKAEVTKKKLKLKHSEYTA